MKKLLLCGTSTNIHLKNYFFLIKDSFDEIKVITSEVPNYECNYELFDYSLKNPFLIKKKIKFIRNIISQFNPCIIHSHQCNSVSYLLGKANSGNIPYVITLWGSDILLLPNKNFLLKKMVQKNLSYAHAITADAEYMLTRAKELGFGGKCINANFGVEIDVCLHENKKENILYSNRLHNQIYNIDKIIIAFSKFVNKNNNWKLIIAGKGNLTNELKKLAKLKLKKNQYEFVGFLDKKNNIKYYKKSKLWVSIPSSDGTSISLLEAMAYGCVPIVSNLDANKEWIKSNYNGILLSNNKLVSAFNTALQLNNKEVATINKIIIKQRATKTTNLIKFLNLYKNILSK